MSNARSHNQGIATDKRAEQQPAKGVNQTDLE